MTRPRGTQLTPPVGEGDRIRGAADAAITLVQYGDYDCPYTIRAHAVVRGLRKRLGERMRFVFRAFPLTRIHQHAQAAAEAAEAAAQSGRFWEMHDRLLEARRKLAAGDLKRYAEAVGLDVARFERELAGHAHKAKVKEHLRSGLRSGVRGTPTYFINGVRHDGPHGFETLLAAIERAER